MRNATLQNGIVVNGRMPDFTVKERAKWEILIDRSGLRWEIAATGKAACACRCFNASRIIITAIPAAADRRCGLKIRAVPANAPT